MDLSQAIFPTNNQSDASIMLARHAYCYSKHKDNFMNITKQKRVARQSNPLSNLDMLEGDIFTRGTSKKVNWQAGRVARKHNISIHQANLIAEILGFGRAA